MRFCNKRHFLPWTELRAHNFPLQSITTRLIGFVVFCVIAVVTTFQRWFTLLQSVFLCLWPVRVWLLSGHIKATISNFTLPSFIFTACWLYVSLYLLGFRSGDGFDSKLAMSRSLYTAIKKFRAVYGLIHSKKCESKARRRSRAQYIVGTNAITLSDNEYGEMGGGRGGQGRGTNWGGMPNEVRVKPGKWLQSHQEKKVFQEGRSRQNSQIQLICPVR